MMPVDLIVNSAYLITLNPQLQVVPQGALAIHQGQIVAVDTTQAIAQHYSAQRVVQATDHLVLPGLVNAHTHVPMTLFRGFADDLPLQTWLHEQIFPAEARFIDPERVRLGTRLALAEMLRGGTTAFNDMYFFEDIIAQETTQAGMRAVLSEGVLDFPTPSAATPQQAFARIEHLHATLQGNPRVLAGVSAHAPYTCSADVLRQAKQLADRLHAPLHLHLAETRWEYDHFQQTHGQTPTQYLASLGVLGPNTVCAHAVHLHPDDISLLAQARCTIVHNPSSNMKLASGIAPIPALLDAGVAVALGTDGAAANNRLDLWMELRTTALLHKVAHTNPTLCTARQVVQMATLGGAQALGLSHQIGSLEVGKRADLIAVSLRRPHGSPMFDPYSHLVYAAAASDVEEVVVDGQLLMHKGQLLSIDEQAVWQQMQLQATEIARWKNTR